MLLSELRARLRNQEDRLGDVEVRVEVRSTGVIFGIADVDYDQFEAHGPDYVIIETNDDVF